MGSDAIDNSLVVKLTQLLSGKVVVSAEIGENDIAGMDIEALAVKIIKHFEGAGIAILTNDELKKIISEGNDKAPITVEVVRSSSFKAEAKDVKPDFSVRNLELEKTGGAVADFSEYFDDRYKRIKEIITNGRNGTIGSMVNSISNIKNYGDGREISICGIVYDKHITKNGHLLVTLEDETGYAKVLFLKTGGTNEIFENGRRLINDDIVIVKGKISGPFVIANSILWPDVPIRSRRRGEDDVAIAFFSDIHVGSKLFLDKQFKKAITWLNGGLNYRKDLAGKVKYVIMDGDVADGIGVYPEQERDLSVDDMYKQYSILLDFIDAIPDYIEVFVLPGNHDAVQRSEPQPPFPNDLIGGFAKGNVHFVSNPSYIKINGVNLLTYHGTSLDSVIQSVPNCSYSKPEEAMKELLKRRHLSPIYGGNIVVPSKNDPLVIDQVPDILHMGHIHKNGVAEYHGTLLINSGTWQARTAFQVRQGHIPTPGILPIYEIKSMNYSEIDFNSELW
ncbi:MAG: DNA-directed DNA polymerase II small subunit [Candidatus Micrarchaeia archaeon]